MLAALLCRPASAPTTSGSDEVGVRFFPDRPRPRVGNPDEELLLLVAASEPYRRT